MAYEKLGLVDGQVLKAEHLEHIENGIKALEESLEEEGGGSGYIPQKGVDYWTAEDIAEIKSYVDEAILGGAW